MPSNSYSPPDQPANPGPFPEQHGYNDLQIKTQNYSDDPSPLNPANAKGKSNIEKIYQDEKTKKAGNFLLGRLKGFLLSSCT
jgi:hypothetical protein